MTREQIEAALDNGQRTAEAWAEWATSDRIMVDGNVLESYITALTDLALMGTALLRLLALADEWEAKPIPVSNAEVLGPIEVEIGGGPLAAAIRRAVAGE